MPVAEFAGTRNWGYDGVCLYAPSRNYGRPDDLRAFVDAAHGLDLAVILDVVYNHLGPEGAYLMQFYPEYLTVHHNTPWGGGVNLDGAGLGCRAALHRRQRGVVDRASTASTGCGSTRRTRSPTPGRRTSWRRSRRAVRAAAPWPVAIHAEDHRNLATLVDAPEDGGWGLDGVWADDFHHVLRSRLAGDAARLLPGLQPDPSTS